MTLNNFHTHREDLLNIYIKYFVVIRDCGNVYNYPFPL